MKITSTTLGFAILAILFGSIAASVILGLWQTGGDGQRNRNGRGGGNEENIAEQNFTLSGIISGCDSSGLSLFTDDGQSVLIQIGNSRYAQSIGFVPQIGERATVDGFINSSGVYNAVDVTLSVSGITYFFRDENNNPLWSRGNGNGNGGNH